MTPEQQALLQIGLGILTIVGIGVSGVFTFIVSRQNRKARQDKTPADTNEATRIANDLILRLLDRANADVTRYAELLETVSEEAKTYEALAKLVPDLRLDLERAERERDRLRKAIQYLEAKARVTKSITYAEVVAWAQIALDPEADPEIFDREVSRKLHEDLDPTTV